MATVVSALTMPVAVTIKLTSPFSISEVRQ